MRIGYTTDCRFFRDNPGVVSKVKWIPAQPDAPVLGFGSVICNRYLDDEPYLFDDLGEVWRAKRPPNNAKKIPGAKGAHVCGTEEDFREGCVRDTSLPPVVYTTSGLPQCCNPVIVGKGGVGIGGLSVPEIVPAPLMRGPLGIGGVSVPSVVTVPGTTCATAKLMTLGVTESWNTAPGAGTSQWLYIPVTSGTTYFIVQTGMSLTCVYNVYHGTTCAGSVLVAGNVKVNRIYVSGSTDNLYLEVVNVSGAVQAWTLQVHT